MSRLFYRFEEKLDQTNTWGKLIDATVKEGIARTDKLEGKIDESVRKSDKRHEETSKRLEKLSIDDGDIRDEQRKIINRINDVEQRMDRYDDKLNNVKSTSDHGDHEQKNALVSAMTIQSKAIAEMKANQEKAELNRQAQMKLQTELLQKLVGWKDAWWFKGAVIVGAMLAAGAASLLSKCGH